MKFQWDIFLAALGLAMIIEGLPYFMAPHATKRTLGRIGEMPGKVLRGIGLVSIAGGLAFVAVSRLLLG
ncbi:MAG TPA: DUF2065 domain-containing protein [Proteobacteria bacterium]|nr:DUF2065 domain-containing protein [Pseudomonadota bacterium]